MFESEPRLLELQAKFLMEKLTLVQKEASLSFEQKMGYLEVMTNLFTNKRLKANKNMGKRY